MSNIYRSHSTGDPTGDAIPFWHNNEYHLFHLSTPRDSLGTTVLRRSYMSQQHVVSRDLVHWKELPTALKPGGKGSCDEDGCWTGSLIERKGVFYLFYAAYDHDSRNPQTVCLARSTDLIHFEKHEGNPLATPGHFLEQIDYRDPYVFWNEDENKYWMLIAARYASGGPFHRRGVIVYRTSDDLEKWSEDRPLYLPWSTVCPECPEMFKMGDYWYLVFSHFSENAKTTYRISKSYKGPWRIPDLPGFEGRRCYALKSLFDGKRRVQWGTIYQRVGLNNKSDWTYAGDMGIPRIVSNEPNGSLVCSCAPEIVESFGKRIDYAFMPRMGDWTAKKGLYKVDSTSSFAYGFFEEESENAVLLKAKLTLEEGNGAFGLLIKSTEELSPSWELVFEPVRSRVCISRYPWPLDPHWATLNPNIDIPLMEVDGPKTIERPIRIEKGKGIECKVFVDGSCVEAFVEERLVLSYRIYDPLSKFYNFGAFVQDGTLTVSDVSISVEG
jgi:beta-fructofuranosidase